MAVGIYSRVQRIHGGVLIFETEIEKDETLHKSVERYHFSHAKAVDFMLVI